MCVLSEMLITPNDLFMMAMQWEGNMAQSTAFVIFGGPGWPYCDLALIAHAGDAVHDGEAAGQDRHQLGGQHRSSGNAGAGHEGGRGQVCLPAGHARVHCRPLRHAAGSLELLGSPATSCSRHVLWLDRGGLMK